MDDAQPVLGDPADVPPAPASPGVPSRERVIGHGVAWTAQWSLRLVLIVAGAIVLGYVVKFSWFILFPVLLALILTTVLAPVAKLLREKAHLPNGLAAAATILGGLAVVVGAGFAIAPSVAGQSGDIVKSANQGIQQLQDWVQNTDFISKAQIDAGLQGLQEKVTGSASSIASGVLTGVSAVTNGLVTLVITLILSFLFLKDGRRFLPWVRRLAGPRAGRHLEEVGTRSWRTLGGFIRTQALVSLIDAVFIGTGLLLVGVPLAIPLAVLTFFAGFIPIVGAFVAGFIAVLVALVSNGPTGALIVLAVIVAVQQLEGNVLSPWLQSKSMKLHAAVVLLSVTLGSTLFGITGAFLAVPVVAVLAVVLRYLDEVVEDKSTPGSAPPYVDGVVAERNRAKAAASRAEADEPTEQDDAPDGPPVS
ncbi:Predicted PurR-regulated permease PerM [Nocardioides scoriae]|uniref:Predicted PurR-regulated permease PerM n=1 Tax=Nocardioides scoriae TaxID=642780 RepID=A0A1H1MX68_9ACTN|nr:AI-2E family transporter [Nocardioides scoriae]SDR90529.1 Predicted PurR-regulated permease PerM [Nocardioides scoriae]